MSDKQKFVRNTAALFVAAHWEKPDAERAVKLANALWKKLTEFGFGDKPEVKPKPRKPDADYLANMNPKQREMFEKFWQAYGLKTGKNEAAMRWQQLGELGGAEYRQIISAATAEAAKPRRADESRKYAQGWLTERRWLDHLESGETGIKSKASDKAVQYRSLIGDLEHAKRIIATYPEGDKGRVYWQQQIEKLTTDIEVLRAL